MSTIMKRMNYYLGYVLIIMISLIFIAVMTSVVWQTKHFDQLSYLGYAE